MAFVKSRKRSGAQNQPINLFILPTPRQIRRQVTANLTARLHGAKSIFIVAGSDCQKSGLSVKI